MKNINGMGEIILFFVSILAALGWFFSKYALVGFPPVGFIGLRFFSAALLFLPFAYPQFKQLTRSEIIRALSTGLVFALFMATWIMAITFNNNLGSGAFLLSISMLLAPLISWVFFHNRPLRTFWIALPTALCGVYLLATSKGAFHFSVDSSLYLLASLFSAIYFVLHNQYSKSIPALALTTLQLLVVGTLCLTYSLLTETWQHEIPSSAIWWLTISVLVGTNFRYMLQTIGQRYCHIANASIIMLLEPVWTIILSVLLLGEQLTTAKIIGSILILSALLIYRIQNVIGLFKGKYRRTT